MEMFLPFYHLFDVVLEGAILTLLDISVPGPLKEGLRKETSYLSLDLVRRSK